MQSGIETTAPSASKGLNIALWVFQVLLAFAFLGAGSIKAFTPADRLAAQMPWVLDVPFALVRFIGAAEIAGALGLLLPSLTRVQPRLTVFAAIGLVAVMALAAAFHVSRGELGMLGPNVVLGGLAAFIAWGRAKKATIAPR